MEMEMNMEELQKRNMELENEVRELKEKLKKYTAPERSKEYAEKVNYYATISPEKRKQYARTAYLNHKEKMKKNKDLEMEATI